MKRTTWNSEDYSYARRWWVQGRSFGEAETRAFDTLLDGSGTTPDHWGADASMAPGTSSVALVLVLQHY